MGLDVLGISCSPRRDGNSELLVRAALEGAEDAGGTVELLSLRGLAMSPCVACGTCERTGVCRIQDDFQPVFRRLLEADRLVFGTPVFFMAVAAQGKTLIDRFQCLWSRKYILGEPLYAAPRDRRALVIAVGGSRSKRMFDSIYFTMKYYLDALEMAYAANLFVNQVDAKGEVREHPTALAEARRLGAELVASTEPVPKRPATVELYGWRDAARAGAPADASDPTGGTAP
jgi:multimeric flavodoxin WrbA